jgi:hypothetical protein
MHDVPFAGPGYKARRLSRRSGFGRAFPSPNNRPARRAWEEPPYNELLFLLETVRREFQSATILGDGAHDIFRCPRLNHRLDFERDFDG